MRFSFDEASGGMFARSRFPRWTHPPFPIRGRGSSPVWFLVGVLVLLGCDSESREPPQTRQTPEASGAPSSTSSSEVGDILMQSRDAAGRVTSYRYTLEMYTWADGPGEEQVESSVRYTGEWVAPGDYHVVQAVLAGEAPDGGPLAVEHVYVGGLHFQRTAGDAGTWRQVLPSPGSGTPRALVPHADSWELAEEEAIIDGTRAYRLRGTSEAEWALAERTVQSASVYHLWVAKEQMLPWHMEVFEHVRVETDDDELVEETQTAYVFRYFDYNAPISIAPPDAWTEPAELDSPDSPASVGAPAGGDHGMPEAVAEELGESEIEGQGWPPFMMVYELKQWPSTVQVLYWRSERQWYIEVIDTPAGLGVDRTGSWRELDGTVYTEFDVFTGRTRTVQVSDTVMIGPVSPVRQQALFRLHKAQFGGLPATVTHEGVEVCYLHECSRTVEVKRFGDGLGTTIYTAEGIPLETPTLRVLLLHLPGR